jgi:serine/threonine protein kinase
VAAGVRQRPDYTGSLLTSGASGTHFVGGRRRARVYDPPMPLTSGAIFAGFRVVRLLGSGGMGEVYLAAHPRLPRQDALKILPRDVSSDAEYRERFNREANLAAALWHPHIVGVHDRGEFEGQIWISMDFVDGVDAARLLADRYPAGMPPDIAVPIVSAMAGALDYAHKRGLLHRDVKPANIMLADGDDDDEQQRVLLADFGIARNLDDISGLTATNMTVGTVAYSAPEQLMGDDIDGRADQYALAATAYHLLTGSQLYPNSNPAVVISRHLNAPPPALADTHPELAPLDRVLSSALAKDPADRFPRCSDFARALTNELAALGHTPSTAPTQPAPSPRRPPSGPTTSEAPSTVVEGRSRRLPILLASTVVVIVLLIAAALVWRPWQHSTVPTAATSGPMTSAPPPPVVTPTSSLPPPPPPPPLVTTASAADQVLLTPSEIVGATDGKFVGSGGGGAMIVTNSAFGTTDHSGVVTPASCVDVVFTAEQKAFGDSNFEAIRDQTLKPDSYSGSGNTVQQTVVVYHSADLAQAVVAAESTHWATCAASDVVLSTGESGYGWNMSSVDHSNQMLSLQMYGASNESGSSFACQQALGARDNVVVSARTCLDSAADNTASPEQFLHLSPTLAGNYGRQVVAAMLDKVRV